MDTIIFFFIRLVVSVAILPIMLVYGTILLIAAWFVWLAEGSAFAHVTFPDLN